MNDTNESLKFLMSHDTSGFYHVTIIVPNYLVKIAYNQAISALQKKINTFGFSKGSVPTEYIEHNYHSHLKEHVKKFLFHYLVISFLFKKLHQQKIIFVGEPRLKNISIENDGSATFEFECTSALFDQKLLPHWKHLPFKAPVRKQYRDIDRQVEFFIEEEQKSQNSLRCPLKVTFGDFICFDIWIIDEKHDSLFKTHKETLWLKIGIEEGDTAFGQIFIDKSVGETFYSDSSAFQEYFSDKLELYALFAIQIQTILPGNSFCFESFKRHFSVKTNKDLRRKLIEVFSFKNDVSQRRLTAEGALSLLLKHHTITVPHHAILRKQQAILEDLSKSPDYHVYKMEEDFGYKIEQLALKQLKEIILLDKIAHDENISIALEDIQYYLNLTKRQRTKEFIYFTTPPSKINGQEIPISSEVLKHYILREKALNHVINHLTKH